MSREDQITTIAATAGCLLTIGLVVGIGWSVLSSCLSLLQAVFF